MVDFAGLRQVVVDPLLGFADNARKLATELEQFGSETDGLKRALSGMWSGTDAVAATNSLARDAAEYRKSSGQYGRLDEIVSQLAQALKAAKQLLESAIGMVPSIPGMIDGGGTITIDYGRLGPNPSQAAVDAAVSRAHQVHDQIRQALQQATDADRRAQSALAGLVEADVPIPQPRPDTLPTGEDAPVPQPRPDTLPTGEDAPVPQPRPDDLGGQTGQDGQGDQGDQAAGGDAGGGDAPLQPVGGLNQAQMNNAATIIAVGERLGISERGQAIALATAMQESNFRNLANTRLPDSLNVPNEGTGRDHDSVGVFQQRPSQGWGSIEECMNVEYAAEAFYTELQRVRGWEDMELTEAAQAVQRSAYPDAYAQWENLAYDILEADD
ncbi:hypothetical protein LX16_2203 [Stackebrandtia albiflava]|uniref:Uncharacterized protein n=2 Tax=Stackebrandtia albiflava TaxID=406432 RepID=A0A562V0S9_9ACTN|nr:hypothetical protein LX16_2203 [Stackebrandtia albiflava]